MLAAHLVGKVLGRLALRVVAAARVTGYRFEVAAKVPMQRQTGLPRHQSQRAMSTALMALIEQSTWVSPTTTSASRSQ